MTGEFVTDPEHPHLAGFIRGGDPAGMCPELWLWAIDTYRVESVIDVGCGDGAVLDWFHERGIKAVGIDGYPQQHPAVVLHDYTLGPLTISAADLAWSNEFVEHVEPRHVGHFMATFKAARVVMVTHALPGQPGHHHVNCRDDDWWIVCFVNHGFGFDAGATDLARKLAPPDSYFRRSGLVFHNETRLA